MKVSAGVIRIWRRWERFVRTGVTVKGKIYSSNSVLTTWAVGIAFLYVFIWTWNGIGVQIDRSDGYALGPFEEVENEVWKGRHLIFCVSPGRAGSKFLSNLLGSARGVIARHEPEPQMNGDVLRQVILDGHRNETFLRRAATKLDAIKYTLDGTPQEIVYAETNHMFVKTFSDVVLRKLGDVANISVVFLHRPLKEIVWSQLQLGWFLNGHSGKNLWYYDIRDVDSSELHASLKETRVKSPIDSLVTYNLDVLLRGMELEKEIKRRQEMGEWQNVKILKTQLTDIASKNGSLQLLADLRLEADEDKIALLGIQDMNARDLKKGRSGVHVTIEDIKDRIEVLQKNLPLQL